MQRKASEQPGKLRISHVDLRMITVVSHLVPFPTEHSTRVFFFFFCVKLRYGTAFDAVGSVLLHLSRLSRRVKFKNIKWHIMGTSSAMLEQSLKRTL